MRTQVRPSTLDSYERNVRRHLAPRIGHVPLQRLTGDQLDALYAQLARDGRRDGHGLSAQTVLYLHRTLAKALGDAVTWGLVTRNAVAAAKPPRRGHNRAAMRTWTAPQLHAFLQSRENERLY